MMGHFFYKDVLACVSSIDLACQRAMTEESMEGMTPLTSMVLVM